MKRKDVWEANRRAGQGWVWSSLLKTRDVVLLQCGHNVPLDWRSSGYSVKKGYEAMIQQFPLKPWRNLV